MPDFTKEIFQQELLQQYRTDNFFAEKKNYEGWTFLPFETVDSDSFKTSVHV